MKYPAPALERGIKVLELLSNNESFSLEEIAEKLKAPKSSLLRILDTLCQINHVSKDSTTKKYIALSAIIPISNVDILQTKQIINSLAFLSKETSLTAEWYLYNGESMVMTEQVEPENSQVYVMAKIGWKRELYNEFEAVARVAIANGCKSSNEKKSYWNYDENGEKENISNKDVSKQLKLTLKEKCTMDEKYNSNGIRRYAAPIMKSNGDLLGIIALAENFTPSANAKSAKKLELLKNETKKLTLKIKK